MPNDTKPIFLLSAPRAGSTMLQRILATHSKISTTPEPYLLLPLVYTMRTKGVLAHYHHPYAVKGLSQFCEALPQTTETYRAHIREFALSLYGLAAGEAPFFLDKTPYYVLIAEDVIDLFPDAKFVVLWRNPVAALASAIEYWGQGKWRLVIVHETMTWGLVKLLDATLNHSNRVCTVQFESLVQDPETEMKRITAYLGLNYEPDMLSSFTRIPWDGKMGDTIGAKKYTAVSREPLEKWKKTMANPLRKAWGRRYLRWLGRKRLEQMGYDMDTILADLEAIPKSRRYLLSDCYAMPRDTAKIKFKQWLLDVLTFPPGSGPDRELESDRACSPKVRVLERSADSST